MRHKKIFLSIDFDFWNYDQDLFIDHVRYFIKYAEKKRIDVTAVTNHQQMLRYVDASDARILFNLDTHSDLVTKKVSIFDCGSWVSYVKWRRLGTYIWMHAGSLNDGDCSSFRGGDFFGHHDKKIDYTETDWRQLKRISVQNELNQMSISRRLCGAMPYVSAISFCTSPGYTNHSLFKLGKNLLQFYNIPILRGRLDEKFYGIDEKYPP